MLGTSEYKERSKHRVDTFNLPYVDVTPISGLFWDRVYGTESELPVV